MGNEKAVSRIQERKSWPDSILRWFGWRRRQRKKHRDTLKHAITLSEVKALIHFVSERGLDPTAETTAPCYRAVVEAENATTSEDYALKVEQVLTHYSALCGLTYPKYNVNGRTVKSTNYAFLYLFGLMLWSLAFLVAALGTELLDRYYATGEGLTAADTTAGELGTLYQFYSVFLVPLSPLFWGGLGSCVFLLKTMSDKVSDVSFDSSKVQSYGYLTRILLGAILGVVVASLFYERADLVSDKIGPSAIAFLTGLGVKAVYGALEELIEYVHGRIVGSTSQ